MDEQYEEVLNVEIKTFTISKPYEKDIKNILENASDKLNSESVKV